MHNILSKTILLLLILVVASSAFAGEFSPGLERMTEGMKSDKLVTVLIVMSEQSDIKSLDAELRASKAKLSTRHREVIESLQKTANRSQGPLKAAIIQEMDNGSVVGFEQYWLVNSFLVRGTVPAIRRLAARADVDVVEPEMVIENIEPMASTTSGVPASIIKDGYTEGLIAIRAPQVLAEFGIDGTGALVGLLDQGPEGTHVAFATKWRGHYAPPEECWLDLTGESDVPVQPGELQNPHGTHVLGTMVGSTDEMTIGVAPGAQWIAANGTDNRYPERVASQIMKSFQFFVDPDDDPSTLDDMPDVVQNSWGVHNGFAGFFDCDTRWNEAIFNCEAAGVVLVFSAGNEGFSGTIRSPAGIALSPTNCFSVGATHHEPPYEIWQFSSRGPSDCGGEFAMKPEVAAPGVDIYSSVTNNSYARWNGTSMAGPHVAGLIALMRSADPDLDVVTMKEVIMATCIDKGAVGEDNNYGHGFIDAYAAVAAIMPVVGYAQGAVINSETGFGIPFATITTVASGVMVTANAHGEFIMPLALGEHWFNVAGFGYNEDTFMTDIGPGQIGQSSWELKPLPSSLLSGIVEDESGQPIVGAKVTVLGTGLPVLYTDAGGNYALNLPSGVGFIHSIEVDAGSAGHTVREIELVSDMTLNFSLGLRQVEDFEMGNSSLWPWSLTQFEVSSEGPFEGDFCLRSLSISNMGTAGSGLFLDVLSPGNMTFKYKHPSTYVEDCLLVLTSAGGVNHSYILERAETWTEASIPLTSGPQYIGWVFFKYGSPNPPYSDFRVSVDLIEFPEVVAPPSPELGLSANQLTIETEIESTSQTPLILYNNGVADLEWSAVAAIPEAKTMVPMLEEAVRQLLARKDSPIAREKLELALQNNADKKPVDGPGISLSVNYGVIAPGASETVMINVDANNVSTGQYYRDLVLTTNDPNNAQAIVPLTLEVVPPDIHNLHTFDDGLKIVPNPFNPMTALMFSLARTADVSLDVYDISGRLVKSIVSETMGVGEYTFTWQGVDDMGRPVASGTYFAKLGIDQEYSVKPMVLVR